MALKPFTFKYKLLPEESFGLRTLSMLSTHPEFVAWNKKHANLVTGDRAAPELDKRMLIYLASQAPVTAQATTAQGYGAQAVCDQNGGFWDKVVVYMNARDIMYGGPGGHKIGNITLPSLESCDYTSNPVVHTGPAPTAPVFKIYHGEISKPQVQQRLKKVGEYLVRDSSQGPGKLALCVRMHAQVGKYPCCKHTNPIFTCLIETLPGGKEYRVQKHTPTFPSLEELVMHYQNHKIVVAKPHTMTQPCPPPGAHASAQAEDDGYEHPKEAYAVFKGTAITFDVKDELGHGNFGIVCKGKVKGKDAAVKVVRIKKPNAGEKPRTEEETMLMQQRGAMDMRKEIIAMEELASFGGHPNLIKLIGFDKSESEPLLALEFCTNGTLKDRAKQSTPKGGQLYNEIWFQRLDEYALDPRFKKWTQAFSDHVNEGGTTEMIREFWPPLLKVVMTLCWELEPKDRPSFASIVKTLSTALEAGKGGGGGTGSHTEAETDGGGGGGGDAAAADEADAASTDQYNFAARVKGSLTPSIINSIRKTLERNEVGEPAPPAGGGAGGGAVAEVSTAGGEGKWAGFPFELGKPHRNLHFLSKLPGGGTYQNVPEYERTNDFRGAETDAFGFNFENFELEDRERLLIEDSVSDNLLECKQYAQDSSLFDRPMLVGNIDPPGIGYDKVHRMCSAVYSQVVHTLPHFVFRLMDLCDSERTPLKANAVFRSNTFWSTSRKKPPTSFAKNTLFVIFLQSGQRENIGDISALSPFGNQESELLINPYQLFRVEAHFHLKTVQHVYILSFLDTKFHTDDGEYRTPEAYLWL
eukprot:gene2706-16141_t